MSPRDTDPTPNPDVNAVLHGLLESVRGVLGEQFVGMYLHGSLATGDFNPNRSDIDFVVVTADGLADEMVEALTAMHARLAVSHPAWGKKLEGSYIPQQPLRRYDRTRALHPHLGTGEPLRVEQHDSAWIIQRHILRERGVTLAGPAPHTLIDPVSPDALRGAVLSILRGWWAPILDHPVLLQSAEYRTYAILTMCRMLYTLQYGTVASKPIAARWAQEALGERWATLIERALAWPHGPQPENLDETLDFIRYTLEQSAEAQNTMDEA